MYLLHIHNCDTLEKAERRYSILREPAMLLKFKDGAGGIALLDRQPMFEGQREFDAGDTKVRQNFLD